MSKAITLTITEDELAELESLLDQFHAETERDKGEHERIMARVDQNLARTEENIKLTRVMLDTPSPFETSPSKDLQTIESENFWLQLENLILRSRLGLPLNSQNKSLL